MIYQFAHSILWYVRFKWSLSTGIYLIGNILNSFHEPVTNKHPNMFKFKTIGNYSAIFAEK